MCADCINLGYILLNSDIHVSAVADVRFLSFEYNNVINRGTWVQFAGPNPLSQQPKPTQHFTNKQQPTQPNLSKRNR